MNGLISFPSTGDGIIETINGNIITGIDCREYILKALSNSTISMPSQFSILGYGNCGNYTGMVYGNSMDNTTSSVGMTGGSWRITCTNDKRLTFTAIASTGTWGDIQLKLQAVIVFYK